MIKIGPEKITARALDPNVYYDELPLHWHFMSIDICKRRIEKKSFRIMNREHLMNCYPEE